MSVDSLQVQIASARQRLSQLQRRADQIAGAAPRAVSQALIDLASALEDLTLAQRQLLVQREALATSRLRVQHERGKYAELFDDAVDASVVTSAGVQIVEANRAAADLLNISQRFLVGKDFSVFVCSERGRMMADARQLAESGGEADWVLEIRPRERAPIKIAARVMANGDGPNASLRWSLQRAGEVRGRTSGDERPNPWRNGPQDVTG